MYLSNGRPFDLFAAFPHCLDNEYWPFEDLPAVLNGLSEDQRRVFRRRRDEAVHRELIRALVYSPQVVVGRQSAVNEQTLIEAARDYPDVVLHLMNEGRLVLLRLEDSFGDFLAAPPFPVDEMGLAVWQPLVRREGEGAVCSLPLTTDQAREVKRRYATFFRGLHDDDEDLRVLFAECSGREISDLQRPEVSGVFEDFRALVHDDLRPWAAEIPSASLGCEAVVPPRLTNSVIADAMIVALVSSTMEACIDVCIHGVVEAGRIVTGVGGRRTISRQLELTDRDRAQLERLLKSAPATKEVRDQDDALRDSEQLAKKSLTSS